MSALCVETLKDCDIEALSKLVPQTLFGTALFSKAKRDERVAEMLTYSEQRTITISHAMDALHRFTRPGGGLNNTSIAYGLLCEASHPNHRGTKLFVQTENIDPAGEYGWRVTYSDLESVPEQLTEKLVEVLIFSMSAGTARPSCFEICRLAIRKKVSLCMGSRRRLGTIYGSIFFKKLFRANADHLPGRGGKRKRSA